VNPPTLGVVVAVPSADSLELLRNSRWLGETGEHGHEFRIADVQHNPLSLDIPTAFPILAQYKPLFTAATKSLVGRLELLRGTNLAFLE